MPQMYARVFIQILDSSLADDWQVRHVFEDLLKLCNIDGVVDMTLQAIARRTNVPLEIVTKGIEVLESPDPNSRDQEHQGRRIIRLDDHRDWGWRVLNWHKYEAIRVQNDMRAFNSARMANYRAKKSGSPAPPPQTPPPKTQTQPHPHPQSVGYTEPTCSTTNCGSDPNFTEQPYMAQVINEMHAEYCKITRLAVELDAVRERTWFEWLKHRWTKDDLHRVVAYVFKSTEKGSILDRMLSFGYLIGQVDRFEEMLAASKAGLKPAASSTVNPSDAIIAQEKDPFIERMRKQYCQ